MGDSRSGSGGWGNELPVHQVYVSAFYMDKFEVTKALWDRGAARAEEHGYDVRPADGSGKAPDHPVYMVTWHEAVKWASARSGMEGLTPRYYANRGKTAVYRRGRVDEVCAVAGSSCSPIQERPLDVMGRMRVSP